MRKSFEQQVEAIETVMMTMSQTAILDGAVRSLHGREPDDVHNVLQRATADVEDWLVEAGETGIDAKLLDGLADMMVGEIREVAPEKLARDAIGAFVAERFVRQLVARQKVAAKVLKGKLLNVTPEADNIVYRVAGSKNYDKPWFGPVAEGDTFLLRAGDNYGGVVNPTREVIAGPYRNYIGYSLVGKYAGEGKAKNHTHYVSIVDESGARQATVTPKQ